MYSALFAGINHKPNTLISIAPALLLILILLTVLASSSTTVQAQTQAYLESNGLVVIQAESVTPQGDWVIESSDQGYTGSGYLRWDGPNLFGTPNVGTMAFTVYISDPGEYNVRLRMSHLGAPAGDMWNDCWARMDEGTWSKALHPADKMDDGFTFDSILEPDFGVFESMRYTLSEGIHTLYLSGRSENLRIDRIHFYKDNVPNPLSLSLPESNFSEVNDNGDDDGDNGDGGDGDNGDSSSPSVEVSGELMQYHPITLTLNGPEGNETGALNPFLDYRFDVTFSQGQREFKVPGFFAADGNAAETSETSGTSWRAHFVPDSPGAWNYSISFRSGEDVSISDNPFAGTPTDQDGITGTFTVSDTDKTGRDHRGKGMLRYVDKHYLQFDNGEYFLKGGANSPENLLAYVDFDGTYNHAGANYIKTYDDHLPDWTANDPTWKGNRGKGLVGALNYLSSTGMNAVYFVTMNVDGDGNDVWPWTSPTDRFAFDVSKLDQWNIVFDHMDRLGLMLHIVLQETENELLLNNGELGPERKLYYRELIARFGHHHAVTWNLGEESRDVSDAQLKQYATYVRELDAYDHPIVVHTYPGDQNNVYTPLLGNDNFEGASLQIADSKDIHEEVRTWRERSTEAQRPWVVSLDELGPYQQGVSEDGPDNNHDRIRAQALWATLMAGGGGVEWYFGLETDNNDLNTENWRTRNAMWQYTDHALEFFQTYLPFTRMESLQNVTLEDQEYVFAIPDSLYAVYLPKGDSLFMEIPRGTYRLEWYNPRTGGELELIGEIYMAGDCHDFAGIAPGDQHLDWVALLTKTSDLVVDDGGGDGGHNDSFPIEIVSFTLIDADTDEVISSLKQGDVLNLESLPPHLNVRAETRTDEGQQIQYVYLELTPTDARRKESVAPYALFGDSAGDYLKGTFEQGELSLTATPYGLDGDPNAPGRALTISFSVEGVNPNTQASFHIGAFEERPSPIISSDESDVPTMFTLEPNYPNPFNPTTTIPFTVLETSQVQLSVYDMQGRIVDVLVDGTVQAGAHSATFDAEGLPSGMYFYTIQSNGEKLTRKMMLVK